MHPRRRDVEGNSGNEGTRLIRWYWNGGNNQYFEARRGGSQAEPGVAAVRRCAGTASVVPAHRMSWWHARSRRLGRVGGPGMTFARWSDEFGRGKRPDLVGPAGWCPAGAVYARIVD